MCGTPWSLVYSIVEYIDNDDAAVADGSESTTENETELKKKILRLEAADQWSKIHYTINGITQIDIISFI